MRSGFAGRLARIAVCGLAMTATAAASAQRASSPQDIVITQNPSKLAGIGFGLAAVGAGIGLGVYFLVRHDSSVTGCAVVGANGLQLETMSDGQSYALVGEVAGIRAGERVRVSGRKEKENPGVPRVFLVSKVKKTYGACAVAAGGF
jgi:hypothetical protein